MGIEFRDFFFSPQRRHTDGGAYMKRYSMPLIIRKCKCYNGYHQKARNNSWWEYGEKESLVHCWWKWKSERQQWKNSMEFPQRVKSRIIIWYNHSTTEYLFKKPKTLAWRNMHSYVQCSIIYIVNMWKQSNRTSIDGWNKTWSQWDHTQWDILQP